MMGCVCNRCNVNVTIHAARHPLSIYGQIKVSERVHRFMTYGQGRICCPILSFLEVAEIINYSYTNRLKKPRCRKNIQFYHNFS